MISLLRNFYNSFISDHKKIWTIVIIIIILFFAGKMIINKNPNVDKNDKQYVNSIYMSDGRIYNNYLSEPDKKMYDFIMDRIKKGKRVTQMTPAEYGCTNHSECFSKMLNATNAIWIDHPELLSFASFNYQYKSDTNILTFRLENSFKLPFMNDVGEMIINHKIHKIQRETKNMTDKEKVKYVYNWIGENAEYDRIFTTSSKNQTIYNVFVNHNAVCAGFAKAAQVIFQAIGIQSYIIRGDTTGPHMWNIVEVDGENYYFDSTVAACIKKDHYMYYDGLKQSAFKDYKPSNIEWYPTLSTNNLFEENEL